MKVCGWQLAAKKAWPTCEGYKVPSCRESPAEGLGACRRLVGGGGVTAPAAWEAMSKSECSGAARGVYCAARRAPIFSNRSPECVDGREAGARKTLD